MCLFFHCVSCLYKSMPAHCNIVFIVIKCKGMIFMSDRENNMRGNGEGKKKFDHRHGGFCLKNEDVFPDSCVKGLMTDTFI